MPPILRRPHTLPFRFRCAAAIAAIFFALLLSAPSALLAATPTKKPAKAEPRKPEGPKEVLIFKNGDQITGKLLNSTGTKIKFDSEVAGEITVPLEKIKELKSDRPFAVVPNTTVVDGRLVAAIRAFGSGSEEHETGAVFAIATSGEDAQRRTILAREGG